MFTRFEYVVKTNIQSIQECDPSKMPSLDMRPHYVSIKFVDQYWKLFSLFTIIAVSLYVLLVCFVKGSDIEIFHIVTFRVFWKTFCILWWFYWSDYVKPVLVANCMGPVNKGHCFGVLGACQCSRGRWTRDASHIRIESFQNMPISEVFPKVEV